MLSITALLAACAIMTFSSVQAVIDQSQHTRCFNYYFNKDHCVSASDEAQCTSAAPAYTSHGSNVRVFTPKKKAAAALSRRYDTTEEVKYVAAGNGICKDYDTTQDVGACIYSGAKGSGGDAKNAGWLNGSQQHACGQQLYVQIKGRPESVKYINVLDGCDFDTADTAEGCPQIYLTEKAFKMFGSPQEVLQGHLDNHLTWDFNNLQHTNPGSSPI